MTTYVIDQSRPLPPTYGDYQHAFQMGDGDTLMLSAGAEVAAYGMMAWGIKGGLNNLLMIEGSVYSRSYGIETHGIVSIGASGEVSGDTTGLRLGLRGQENRTLSVLTNAGTISGGYFAAVDFFGEGKVTNSGSIVGGKGGIWGVRA